MAAYHLLVGCDGRNSRVRQELERVDPGMAHSMRLSYRGYKGFYGLPPIGEITLTAGLRTLGRTGMLSMSVCKRSPAAWLTRPLFALLGRCQNLIYPRYQDYDNLLSTFDRTLQLPNHSALQEAHSQSKLTNSPTHVAGLLVVMFWHEMKFNPSWPRSSNCALATMLYFLIAVHAPPAIMGSMLPSPCSLHVLLPKTFKGHGWV